MRKHLAWSIPVLAAALTAPFARGDDGDGRLFAAAGGTLFSAHWSHAFADRGIQVGPLQLLLYGSVGRSTLTLSVVLAVGAALLAVAATRAAGVSDPLLLGGAGFVVVVTGLARNVYEAGHPADALLPLLWVIAAADARRGRVLRAGLLVGLSAGFETWGILGLAVLVLAPRALAVALATAAGLFAPFILSGHFESTQYEWTIRNATLLGHLLPSGTPFGWPLRLLQGGAGVAAGALVTWRWRRSPHAVWAVPLLVVAVRLLLDPLDSLYYFAGLATPALVGLALVASRRFAFSLTAGRSSAMSTQVVRSG